MGEPEDNDPQMKKWIIDIVEGLYEAPPRSSYGSICKVPRSLRSVNEDAYTPHLVSIGPIHHGDKKLLPMEYHKRRYLHTLFKRTQDPIATLESYCYNILDLDEDVRAIYAEPIVYNKRELATILLHDAGFMLELFLRYAEWDSKVHNDPIFTTSWMILKLQRDLALLENQIPFFVLKYVFKLIVPRGTAVPSLKELALQFFKSILNISEEAFLSKYRQKGDHLLHLLHNCYLPTKPIGSRSERSWKFLPSATSLSVAGVVFEKNTRHEPFDLQFHNGTFKIPPLLIHDSTDSLFRNLVAFEQCQGDSKHYITSYVILMERLIGTANDVEFLQEKRIIENDFVDGGDVSNLFNNICEPTVLKDFYYAGLCNEVNAYVKSPWQRSIAARRRYIAALRSDYFKNPWSIISFVAATTLIVLTILQTVYSVLSYRHR